jgi:hypothetical protein
MGHVIHTEMLCGLSGRSSSSSNIFGTGCSEVNDSKYMHIQVTMPPSLQLLSDDADLGHLQQQLAAAVEEGWSLPLARNMARVLLASFTAQLGTARSQQAPAHALMNASPGGDKLLYSAFSQLAERSNNRFVACSFDPSLSVALSDRFLFSASLGPSVTADALPNMLLQLLHVALLLEPGLSYISIHAAVPAREPSSSELLAWLDLLQLLLVPLGVPLHLVVDRTTHPAVYYSSCSTWQECSCRTFLSAPAGSCSSSTCQ